MDDNVATAGALAKILGSANFATHVYFRGNDAIACAQNTPFDGAVIDIHLPDINGLVLSKKLREFWGPAKPIIILSGDSSMEVINSLPHVGATHFFSKPVSANRLLEHLRREMGLGEGTKAQRHEGT
ncbi:MAG TPA: response regulator [Humisphaera sp.]|nr:response regulator [Humisphaera sp.]